MENVNKKSLTLLDLYDNKRNSFDIIRIILALLVLYDHSYALLLGAGKRVFITSISSGQLSTGQFAVYGFFVISGFLITQSMENSTSYINYYKKRILRIFPAFLFSLFVISFIVGPIITKFDLKTYLFDLPNNPFVFVFRNITLNIFGYGWSGGDLFLHNPFPRSANGSMWTLKHEFAMYLIIPILYFFYFFRYRVLMIIFTGFMYILYYLNLVRGYVFIHFPANKAWVLGSHEYKHFILLALCFLVGSSIYLYRNKIIYNKRFVVLSLSILYVFMEIHKLKIVFPIFFPYILIYFGTRFNFSFIRKYGDPSYGIYIYAFPIQQLLVYLFKTYLSVFSLIILSSVITITIAYLSWKYIEKPALKLKTVNLFSGKLIKNIKYESIQSTEIQ